MAYSQVMINHDFGRAWKKGSTVSCTRQFSGKNCPALQLYTVVYQNNANITNRFLAEDGPGFPAFIVDNSINVTADAVNRLLGYAEQGFPILFVGGVPEVSQYYSGHADEYVKECIQSY